MSRRPTRPQLGIGSGVAGLVMGLVIAGGVAVGLEPPSETIQACVKDDGLVRIVGDSSTCKPQEHPVSWSRQGPPGPEGPQGPAGEPGDASAGFYADQGQSGGRMVWGGRLEHLRALPPGVYQVTAYAGVNVTTSDYVVDVQCEAVKAAADGRIIDGGSNAVVRGTRESVSSLPVIMTGHFDVAEGEKIGVACEARTADVAAPPGTDLGSWGTGEFYAILLPGGTTELPVE